MTKKQIIKKINKVGIQDIICTSVCEEDGIYFCIEIRTNDDNSFHFEQRLDLNPKLQQTKVVYFDETGDGDTVADLGTGFNSKTYKYPKRASRKET